MSGFDNDVVYAKNADFTQADNQNVSESNGLATNGQLWIGRTAVNAGGTHIDVGFLTAGTGISINNGPGSITIGLTGSGVAVEHLTGNTGGQLNPDGSNNFNILGTGGITFSGSGSTLTSSITQNGFTWTDVTSATQILVVQNGYLTDRGGGVTYTLPSTASIGDTLKIVGKLGLATITPNANQQILIGSTSGQVGILGTAVSNNVGDCIELVCITSGASSVYRADSVVGTWTLTV